MPSRPSDSDALVARDGLRTLAAGAKVEWKPGQTATRPQATNVWVI
jgi:cold shock CspA family protein